VGNGDGRGVRVIGRLARRLGRLYGVVEAEWAYGRMVGRAVASAGRGTVVGVPPVQRQSSD